jgi:DNA-binding winged helix-turn-helix (wHTH) protein
MATHAHSMVDPTATSIAFGPFRLYPMQRRLTEAGIPVHLGSRAFDILVALLEHPGELVSKEELMAKVWPNTFVTPANIAVHILALRRALGEGLRGSRYVVNIPGRGYCFVAAITVEKDLASKAAGGVPAREHKLPHHSASAVGRGETVHEQPHKLEQRRLLIIVGPDGGNTLIAFPLVEKLIETHDNGVWFVSLTPCDDHREINVTTTPPARQSAGRSS